MNITIDKVIKELTPEFNVATMICDVEIYDEKHINTLISTIENSIKAKIDIKEVVNLPVIKEARDAYKKYGKDPSRYRLATESLYRRLSKGNKLYRINNVVDLGNILSIETRRSVAVLDFDKIKGDINIRLGKKTDEYFGIGRGSINIENIPLYEDNIGPFGSSTSDTERTMITPTTTKILLFIISFNGLEELWDQINHAKVLYQSYAKGKNFLLEIL